MTNFFRAAKSSSVKNQAFSLQRIIDEGSVFIRKIESGDLSASLPPDLMESKLGEALLSMKNHLEKIAADEKERSWLNVGLATFSDILRNKQSLSLADLSDSILKSVVKYVGANQGAIFILETEQDDKYLEMLACYAYDRKKHHTKKIAVGDGLVGQCVLEQEPVYMTKVPESYITITSGLGMATPRSIFISPLLLNDEVFGVMELASFTPFEKYKMEFINRLSENIAATIKNVKDSERTVKLLKESQLQAEQLRAQEEEMRQNMEEMQATQEEMARKSDQIAKASAEMESLLRGVNTTMATIEFEPDGTIITANENFQKAMKCNLKEIKGKHHQIFVSHDVLASDDYKTFWSRLASGQSITGVFRRIAKDGSVVWLNAIYNPVFNATGEVVKVVKFANDITKEQEMMAETQGILAGINATMATIEFEPDGTIITANENFQKVMKCRVDEIKGKHHKIFVSKHIQESEDYKTFWGRLASGEAITGTFERVTSNGEIVWLNAIYNPICNAMGQVVKVVKFATEASRDSRSF